METVKSMNIRALNESNSVIYLIYDEINYNIVERPQLCRDYVYIIYTAYIYVQESFHLQSALKACETYLEILSRDVYLHGWHVCVDR